MTLSIGKRYHGGTLSLPVDAVTQTFGILAKRRVGKTYTASVMAEEFAAAQVPFAVLDPTGAWWGLRSSASGKSAGLPVVILGGAHGDVPLEATGGKLVADLVVDHPGYYVLDLEAFESNAEQDRFVADFGERLYRRKAKVRDPMHLFIDEADSFAPQRPGANQLRMLGAIEAIVRRGGIRGLGSTLISQRAAVVNKNVLTQLDVLIVMQITGPQDQDAVRDWVKNHASTEELQQIMSSMPSLGRGEAWFYSPGWLAGTLARITVRERRTFNSSATPEVGEKRIEPSKLAAVDLDAVRSAMAATIEKAKADDPAELRKTIHKLERTIAEFGARPVETITEKVEVPILTADDHKMLTEAWMAAARAGTVFEEAAERIAEKLRVVNEQARIIAVPPRKPPADFPNLLHETMTRIRPRSPSPVAQDGQNGASGASLRAGGRKMLGVLARSHPIRLNEAQLGTLARFARKGGTFGAYMRDLKRLGYIEIGEDKLITITSAGLDAAGVAPGNPMSAEEVREQYRTALRAGERAMFDELVSAYPDGLDRERLAERTGFEVSGGTFGAYVRTLRRNGLVEGDSILRATATALGQI